MRRGEGKRIRVGRKRMEWERNFNMQGCGRGRLWGFLVVTVRVLGIYTEIFRFLVGEKEISFVITVFQIMGISVFCFTGREL